MSASEVAGPLRFHVCNECGAAIITPIPWMKADLPDPRDKHAQWHAKQVQPQPVNGDGSR